MKAAYDLVMEASDLLTHAKRLRDQMDEKAVVGGYAEVCEFLKIYAGPKSSFLEAVRGYNPRTMSADFAAHGIREVLRGFIAYVQAGLNAGVSPERRAQLDVVADFLGMAQVLLETKSVHPAAAAVLVGATLEEFLRNWAEDEGLSLGSRKPGMEAYSQILREADLISKQDAKDLTSWSGIRNHAAHGEWSEVSDKARIFLMLEGVNLFMRRYTPA